MRHLPIVVTLIAVGMLVAGAETPLGQRLPTRAAVCLHDADESPQHRTRRMEALRLVRAINAAEGQRAEATRRYAPLAALGTLPAPPESFALKLYATDAGYLVSLKDSRDPCRYAIFSDESGHVYESSARAPLVAD